MPAGCGVTVIPGTVPAGQTSGVVGLKAAADSPLRDLEVQIVGRGGNGQTVTASGTVVFAHQTISTPGFGMAGTIPSYTRPFVEPRRRGDQAGPILLNPEPAKARGAAGRHSRGPGPGGMDGQGRSGSSQLAALSPRPG